MSSCYAGSLVKLTLFTVVITTFVMSGCCKQVQFTPQQPNSVRGWQEFDDGVITAMGEFFLRKGEKIDNGHFGVELIKTVAPQKCYEPFAENILIPHAVLRFYEVSTKRTILEIDAPRHSNQRLVSFGFPLNSYGVDSVLVNEVNTRDAWVWFELLK